MWQTLNQSPGVVLVILICVVLALTIMVVYQFITLSSMRQAWKNLFNEADGENIERLLMDQLKQSVATEQQVHAMDDRVTHLEQKIKSSKRYLGLVRYDAFQEVGGEQSFAMALYDEEGDGVIITSQVGREQMRIYAKQIYRGQSERNLSSEEQEAIERAGNLRASNERHR